MQLPFYDASVPVLHPIHVFKEFDRIHANEEIPNSNLAGEIVRW